MIQPNKYAIASQSQYLQLLVNITENTISQLAKIKQTLTLQHPTSWHAY